MSERAFLVTAGIVFLLIAFGHLARIVFGVPFIVQDIAVPLWLSGIAVVIAGFLSYEGFHFARKAPPKE
jgi:hypothetical protein